MAAYQFTSDLVADVLFRTGEPVDGSSAQTPAIVQLLNRAYNTVIMGGGEFDNKLDEEWWWLHKDPPGTLILEAPVTAGTVAVTNNSATATLSSAPAVTKATWFFKVDIHSDVFRVSAHTGGSGVLTLDTVYTGPTVAAANYKLFKLEYSLPTDLYRITSQMRIQAGGQEAIDGVELSTMDRDYPIAFIEKGIPNQFANVTESKVRFNRYGIDTGGSLIRVEYDYLFKPSALTNAASEEPLVPIQYRQVLADIAYFYLLQSKHNGSMESSTRMSQAAGLIKNGLQAMATEHRHRMIIHGQRFGVIQPRQSNLGRFRRPLRTESGFIIG